MNDYERKTLDEFFNAIEPNLAGYKHASLRYLALKKGEIFELTQGRLLLQGVPTTIPSRYFQSKNIKAGLHRLDELKLTPKAMIDSLLSGVLRLPHGELHFPPEQTRSHSLHFNPYYSDGISLQHRQVQLYIRGARRESIRWPALDWELKAASTPFDSIQELSNEFSVGPTDGESLGVEVIALNVAGVGGDSAVTGTQANLVINLAHGLERGNSSLGYIIVERNMVVKRASISGAALSWSDTENFQHGEVKMEVRAGAAVHCVACYADQAQHHWWIADPATAQNPFRAVHQAFDSKLEVLHELISKAQSRGANARDLEVAVSWLLWMLGFSATHIGAAPKTSDGPDLIAATPLGNFAVIECTTGILKEDNKLPHLVQRAEKVRETLAASGHQHLRVLPILVTTKTRDEVKADLEQAHKLGVLVATREDFSELINRTLVFPDANRLYAQAEETMRRSLNPPKFPSV